MKKKDKVLLRLSETQQAELEEGYKNGPDYRFRQRCLMVLLTFKGLSIKEIGQVLEIKMIYKFNRWVKRYQKCYAELGLEALRTNAPGQGRKSILIHEQDINVVCQAVKSERKRLSQKRLVEEQTGKTFHVATFVRFLKKSSVEPIVSKRYNSKKQL